MYLGSVWLLQSTRVNSTIVCIHADLGWPYENPHPLVSSGCLQRALECGTRRPYSSKQAPLVWPGWWPDAGRSKWASRTDTSAGLVCQPPPPTLLITPLAAYTNVQLSPVLICICVGHYQSRCATICKFAHYGRGGGQPTLMYRLAVRPWWFGRYAVRFLRTALDGVSPVRAESMSLGGSGSN